MDDINIYEDLENFDLNIKYNEVAKEKEILAKENDELKKKVYEQNEKIQKLEELVGILKKNISALYKTAKSELNKKNKIISELRSNLDNLTFRRNNSNITNVNEFKNPYSLKRYRIDNNENNKKRMKFDENNEMSTNKEIIANEELNLETKNMDIATKSNEGIKDRSHHDSIAVNSEYSKDLQKQLKSDIRKSSNYVEQNDHSSRQCNRNDKKSFEHNEEKDNSRYDSKFHEHNEEKDNKRSYYKEEHHDRQYNSTFRGRNYGENSKRNGHNDEQHKYRSKSREKQINYQRTHSPINQKDFVDYHRKSHSKSPSDENERNRLRSPKRERHHNSRRNSPSAVNNRKYTERSQDSYSRTHYEKNIDLKNSRSKSPYSRPRKKSESDYKHEKKHSSSFKQELDSIRHKSSNREWYNDDEKLLKNSHVPEIHEPSSFYKGNGPKTPPLSHPDESNYFEELSDEELSFPENKQKSTKSPLKQKISNNTNTSDLNLNKNKPSKEFNAKGKTEFDGKDTNSDKKVKTKSPSQSFSVSSEEDLPKITRRINLESYRERKRQDQNCKKHNDSTDDKEKDAREIILAIRKEKEKKESIKGSNSNNTKIADVRDILIEKRKLKESLLKVEIDVLNNTKQVLDARVQADNKNASDPEHSFLLSNNFEVKDKGNEVKNHNLSNDTTKNVNLILETENSLPIQADNIVKELKNETSNVSNLNNIKISLSDVDEKMEGITHTEKNISTTESVNNAIDNNAIQTKMNCTENQIENSRNTNTENSLELQEIETDYKLNFVKKQNNDKNIKISCSTKKEKNDSTEKEHKNKLKTYEYRKIKRSPNVKYRQTSRSAPSLETNENKLKDSNKFKNSSEELKTAKEKSSLKCEKIESKSEDKSSNISVRESKSSKKISPTKNKKDKPKTNEIDTRSKIEKQKKQHITKLKSKETESQKNVNSKSKTSHKESPIQAKQSKIIDVSSKQKNDSDTNSNNIIKTQEQVNINSKIGYDEIEKMMETVQKGLTISINDNSDTNTDNVETKIVDSNQISKNSTTESVRILSDAPVDINTEELDFLINTSISVMKQPTSIENTKITSKKSSDEIELLKNTLISECENEKSFKKYNNSTNFQQISDKEFANVDVENFDNGSIINTKEKSNTIDVLNESNNSVVQSDTSNNEKISPTHLKNKYLEYKKEIISDNKIRITIRRQRRR